MILEQMPHRGVRRQEHRRPRHHNPNHFFGVDVEKMSPKAQVAAGLAVAVPIVLSAPLFLTVFSEVWWIFMTYFWAIFPAFGLLVRGIAGLFDGESSTPSGNGKERELLQALREHGELTPAWAAMETSLMVSEADGMLKGLADGGHLEVRVRGGSLSYALWEPERAALEPRERV